MEKRRKFRFPRRSSVIGTGLLPLLLLFLHTLTAPASAQLPLNPAAIPKYITPLFIPPAMPSTGTVEGGAVDYYEIAKQQFQQQILPAGFPATTVWGFGSVNHPGTFHSPSYTIEADVNRPARVKWINNLKDPNTGNYLPHLFSADVDQTLHWANPPQECADGSTRTDCEGTSGAPYLGPVPMIVHLHGSHVTPESDGFPEAWYLPAANNIPAGYATQGSHFGQIAGAPLEPGAAVFQYRNDQRATTLWFHDHSLGLTRLNMYAGPVGFYLLRGGPSDLPEGMLPEGAYEIPMVIQDKSFLDDGSLNFASPAGDGDGDTMVVNGNTWPYLNVEPRRYRFRFLNASNNNPIDLELATDNTPDGSIDDGNWTALVNPFTQIGADGGFLPAPAAVQQIILHIAERADAIVDFSDFTPGTVIYMVNDGGDPGTTEPVMRFIVVSPTSADTSTPTDQLILPSFVPLGPADYTRQVSLNDGGPGQPGNLLGIVDPGTGLGIPLRWADAITEDPQFNSTEIWEIHNFSGSEHPIHIHVVQFEIIDRRALGTLVGDPSTILPGPGETGTKDTVIVGDNEIVRVKAKFDIPGLFVWHCHILDHEDDEMMRPYTISAPPPQADTVGVSRPSTGEIFLKNSNTTGFADTVLNYGLPGDLTFVGDWNGDFVDTVGVYRDGLFYLRNSNTSGFAEIVFPFGMPGDLPVAGDWNGDGIDTVGTFRNGTFFLRNSNSAGVADAMFDLGIPGDLPVAGDWNGDGIDTVGVFRPSTGEIFLKNSNTAGFADIVLNYGLPGDKPVIGDWDADGIDTIGVYRDGVFYLRNSNTPGFADIVFAFGIPGDDPIAGDWDGLQ